MEDTLKIVTQTSNYSEVRRPYWRLNPFSKLYKTYQYWSCQTCIRNQPEIHHAYQKSQEVPWTQYIFFYDSYFSSKSSVPPSGSSDKFSATRDNWGVRDPGGMTSSPLTERLTFFS